MCLDLFSIFYNLSICQFLSILQILYSLLSILSIKALYSLIHYPSHQFSLWILFRK